MSDQSNYLDYHPRVRIFLLALLLLFTVILGLGTYAAAKLNRPFNEDGETKIVTVPKGTSSRDIARVLEREKIISSGRVFLYYLLVKDAHEKIQAGTYELSGAMTIPAIVEKLTRGEIVSNEIRVRIGEGWTLDTIARQIEESGLGEREEFFKLAGSTPTNGGRPADTDLLAKYKFLERLPSGASLEGYLFPDTYIVSRDGGVSELAHKALLNFERKFDADMLASAQQQSRDWHEVMIVASMIEAEVGRNVSGRALTKAEAEEVFYERFIVSDIFWTRLRLGMALQSDATVGYATGKPRRQASLDDLQFDSLYNTYKFSGLPPGPINNPSLEAIKAALNPADTDYLYFLSAPDGKAYFAKTLAEHNRNREKYLGD